MADSVLNGALSMANKGSIVQLKSPFDCVTKDVLEASALILLTTENFGYMSGALKDFFERIYYPCLEDEPRSQSKPYALIIKAGLDGTGATTSVGNITRALRWKEAHPLLLCKGEFAPAFIDHCYTLGQTMQASLEAQLI